MMTDRLFLAVVFAPLQPIQDAISCFREAVQGSTELFFHDGYRLTMSKASSQLRAKPVVLLERLSLKDCAHSGLIVSRLGAPSLGIKRAKSHEMSRYPTVKKSTDSRDHPSLCLKINLTSGGAVPCIKRKASLEETFAEADTVYARKKSKLDPNSESERNGVKSLKLSHQQQPPAEEGKTKKHSTSSELERDRDRDRDRDRARKKVGDKHRSLKGDDQADSPRASLSPDINGVSSSRKEKKKDRKKRSKDKLDKHSTADHPDKSRSKHSSSSGCKLSDAGEISEEEHGSQGIIVPVSVAHSDITIDIVDESVFEEQKKLDSALALLEFGNEIGIRRSDSMETVLLQVEDNCCANVSVDNIQAEEVVETANELVSQPPSSSTDNSDSIPDDEMSCDERQEGGEPPAAVADEGRTSHGDIASAGDKRSAARLEPADSIDQDDVDSTKRLLLAQTHPSPRCDAIPAEAPDESTQACLKCVKTEHVAMETTEQLQRSNKGNDEEPQESPTEASDVPGVIVDGSGVVKTLMDYKEPADADDEKDDVLGAYPPEAVDGKVFSSQSVDLASKRSSCCISMDIVDTQLDERESEIRQQQIEIKEVLLQKKVERQGLDTELRALTLDLELQGKELRAMEGIIAADGGRSVALREAAKRQQEERNQLLSLKKKLQTEVLETEIQLRELQLALCRQQLQLGSEGNPHDHPLADEIRIKEEKVAEFTNLVASKSAKQKEVDASYVKAEATFQQKNDESQTIREHLEETQKSFRSTENRVAEIKAHVTALQSRITELSDERQKIYLQAVDFEEELIKIHTCRLLKAVQLKRTKILNAGDAEDDEALELVLREFLPATPRTPSVAAEDVAAGASVSSVEPPPTATAAADSPPLQPLRPDAEQVRPETPADSDAYDQPFAAATEEQPDEPTGSVLVDHRKSPEEAPAPQTMPICLRKSPLALPSLSPVEADDGPLSGQLKSRTPPIVLPSPRVVESQINANPRPTVSPGHLVTSPPVGHSISSSVPVALADDHKHVQQISLAALEVAVSFFAQFLGTPGIHSGSETDEKTLYQHVVVGCRKFFTWSTSMFGTPRNCLRDPAAVHHSAGYVKDFLIPFCRLLRTKGLAVHQLIDAIVHQTIKCNHFGLAAVEPRTLQLVVTDCLLLAVEAGTLHKDKVVVTPSLPPSRVEFSPSSGDSSLPTFTIHPPAITPVPSAVSDAVAVAVAAAVSCQQRSTPEQSLVTPNAAAHSDQQPHKQASPMGTLNSLLTGQQAPRPAHHTHAGGLMSSGQSPTASGPLISDVHPALRQGWAGAGAAHSAMLNYSPQPGIQPQNTAVVAPVQYSSNNRHRMTAAPVTSAHQPHGIWPQQQHQQQQQQQMHATRGPQYVSNHLASQQQQQSGRMAVQAYPGQSHYRQQHPAISPHHQQQMQQPHYSHYHVEGPMQQPQHVNGLSSRNDMARAMGAPMHGQSAIPQQQQRMRQLSASQQSQQLPTAQYSPGQQPQQPASVHSHAAHQGQMPLSSRVLQMPTPSPPVAQSQRLFPVQQAQQPVTTIRQVSQESAQQLPAQSHTAFTCLKCGQEAHQKCSGCQTTFYCSRECQVAHWEEHGKVCSKQI